MPVPKVHASEECTYLLNIRSGSAMPFPQRELPNGCLADRQQHGAHALGPVPLVAPAMEQRVREKELLDPSLRVMPGARVAFLKARVTPRKLHHHRQLDPAEEAELIQEAEQGVGGMNLGNAAQGNDSVPQTLPKYMQADQAELDAAAAAYARSLAAPLFSSEADSVSSEATSAATSVSGLSGFESSSRASASSSSLSSGSAGRGPVPKRKAAAAAAAVVKEEATSDTESDDDDEAGNDEEAGEEGSDGDYVDHRAGSGSDVCSEDDKRRAGGSSKKKGPQSASSKKAASSKKKASGGSKKKKKVSATAAAGGSGDAGANKRRRTKILPTAIEVLSAWFVAHVQHPYPSEADKEQLMRQANVDSIQVNNWFTNTRKRFWYNDSTDKSKNYLSQTRIDKGK